MLGPEFLRHALLAGTAIALAAGLVGWFVVLRAQVFAGDALGHVAFAGAVAAAALGLQLRAGLFAATVAAALALALLGSRARAEDDAIGVLFAWILGLGALALHLLATGGSASDGAVASRALFGSILGLDGGQAGLAAVLAIGVVIGLGAIARPLLLASLDPEGARARRVPVRALDAAFLVLVGVVAAEAAQALGALLLLGLLAAPAGTAHRLTTRPYRGMLLSGALAVAAVWGGLALSYHVGTVPPSSAVVGLAVLAYAAAGVPIIGRWSRAAQRSGPR